MHSSVKSDIVFVAIALVAAFVSTVTSELQAAIGTGIRLWLALGFAAGALVVVIWEKYFPIPAVKITDDLNESDYMDMEVKISLARFCEQAGYVFWFLFAAQLTHYLQSPFWAGFGQASAYIAAGLVGALFGFACFEDLFEDLSKKTREMERIREENETTEIH